MELSKAGAVEKGAKVVFPAKWADDIGKERKPRGVSGLIVCLQARSKANFDPTPAIATLNSSMRVSMTKFLTPERVLGSWIKTENVRKTNFGRWE